MSSFTLQWNDPKIWKKQFSRLLSHGRVLSLAKKIKHAKIVKTGGAKRCIVISASIIFSISLIITKKMIDRLTVTVIPPPGEIS